MYLIYNCLLCVYIHKHIKLYHHQICAAHIQRNAHRLFAAKAMSMRSSSRAPTEAPFGNPLKIGV